MIKVSKQAVEAVAAQRPEGYIQKLACSATRDDAEHYYFKVGDYARLYEEFRGKSYRTKHFDDLERQTQKLSRIVAWLKRFRKPEDRGLGDTLERMLSKVGGWRFKHLMQLMNLPCGCDDRQRWLNERYPYS